MDLFQFGILVLLAFYATLETVDAVACKANDCVDTMHVKATCTSEKCECETNFFPTPTGCGAKLAKPAIEYGTNPDAPEVYAGQSATLKCVSAGAPMGTTYTFKESTNDLTPTKDNEYTKQFATAVSETYKCQAMHADYEDSDESEDFTVKVIAAGVEPTNAPMIQGNGKSVTMQGATLHLTCTGLPIGYTKSSVTYTNKAGAITNPNSVVVAATDEIKCAYMGKASTKLTVAATLPKPQVIIKEFSKATSELTVKAGTVLNIECDAPAVALPTVKWTYTKDSVTFTNTNLGAATTGNAVYKCAGKVGAATEVESDVFTVKGTTTDVVKKPTIEIKPDTKTVGDHVTLECKTDTTGVTYAWMKGGEAIYGQSDNIIQINNAQLSTDVYKCSASATQHKVDSNDNTLKLKPTKPTLMFEGSQKNDDVSLGSTIKLSCKATAPAGLTGIAYKFKKGTTDLTSATLSKVSSSNDGDYTCTATFDGVVSDASDTLTIKVGAAGLYCANNDACKGDGYTGVCTTNRCVCADGYEAKEDKCIKSSATSLVVSSVGLLLAFVLTKLI